MINLWPLRISGVAFKITRWRKALFSLQSVSMSFQKCKYIIFFKKINLLGSNANFLLDIKQSKMLTCGYINKVEKCVAVDDDVNLHILAATGGNQRKFKRLMSPVFSVILNSQKAYLHQWTPLMQNPRFCLKLLYEYTEAIHKCLWLQNGRLEMKCNLNKLA